jgi:hypothetical protein
VLIGAVVSAAVGMLILRVNPVKEEASEEEAASVVGAVPGLSTN